MDLMNIYGSPVITNWEVDNDGNKVSIPIYNETKQVTGNKIVLEGIPDEQRRVFLEGFVEVDIRDKIENKKQFKVDYRKNGVIFVHESLDGEWVTVSEYSSMGMYYVPSSRVWTKVNDFGEVIETLDGAISKIDLVSDIIANLDESIDTAKGLRTELNTSINTGNTTRSGLDGSISTSITKKTQLDNSISTSTTSKSDLDTSISSASTSKSKLDISIGNATTSRSNLDSSISSGDALKVNLDESITNGTTLKNNLDANITTGDQLKVDLPPLISSAGTAKTNLDGSINLATTKKSELDGSIGSATTKKTDLDSSISSANTINNTLSNSTSGTIKKANDANSTLNTSISSSNSSKTVLDESIATANTSKINLDESVATANSSKSNLDSSVASANTKKSELDTSISSANTINNTLANPTTGIIKKATDINSTLSGNISTATTRDADLKATIVNANTSNGDLDTSIENSITAKSNLDDSITTANTTKTELDSSITTGNALKGELDDIVSGTDYEQVIIDVNSMRQDQHNHTNKNTLDGLSDVSGKLKYNGQDIGIGDMEKFVYDIDGDGKVDVANNSEKLGGQLPSYYAKQSDVNNKVDKVAGKQLSTEDYTTTEKNKLTGIATNATKNDTDANLKSRANHTGTQLASTISDFANTVRATALTELSLTTNAVISAADTILSALGKLQKQISDNLSTLTNHINNKSNPHSVTKTQIDLGNVDNTSDLNKPISTATQTALSGKVDNSRVLTDVPVSAKFTDTTYGIATNSTNGLMSSTDKQNLDTNTTSRHTHNNKSVIDKFTEVDNKPYYNGEEIGGKEIGGAVPNLTLNELTLGGRFKIVYNDIEDSLDIEVI